MKKSIIFFMAALVFSNTYSQPNTVNTLPVSSYLKKSKNQKTTAWVLLGAGTVMIVGGGR